MQWRADLLNVTDLALSNDAEQWAFKFKCSSCHEENPNQVTFHRSEFVDLPGSRGQANLAMKCKFCKKDASVDVDASSIRSYSVDDSGHFKGLVVLECRGIEPVDWVPYGEFIAKATESEQQFEFELAEKEWYDYDDSAQVEVSVSDLQWKIVGYKK